MAIDTTRTHLRTITFLGAGAAILAVIGYLLMKSDRKKPRRKSSKSAGDSVTNLPEPLPSDHQLNTTQIDNLKILSGNEEKNKDDDDDVSYCSTCSQINQNFDNNNCNNNNINSNNNNNLKEDTNSITNNNYNNDNDDDDEDEDDKCVNSVMNLNDGDHLMESSLETSILSSSSSTGLINARNENHLNKNSQDFDQEEEVVEEEEEEEEEDNDHEDVDDEEEQKHSTSIIEPEMDKLSDASSDSGNGQSDIVQMYNCLIEYEDDSQHSIDKNDKTSCISNSSTDDDNDSVNKTKEISPPCMLSQSSSPSPVPMTPAPEEAISETIEISVECKKAIIKESTTAPQPPTPSTKNTAKSNKKNKTASNSSSNNSSLTSLFSFHTAKSKTGRNKNSKINFEPKKSAPTSTKTKQRQQHESFIIEEDTREKFEEKNSVEDLVVYEFNFPRRYCGKLIGRNGVNVDYIRNKTKTQIAVRNDALVDDLQVVCVSGRLEDVDAALDIISLRFPAQLYPQVSFKPISKPIVYRRYDPENKSLFEQSKVLVASNMFVELSDVMKNKSTLSTEATKTSEAETDSLNESTVRKFNPNVKFSVHVTAVVSGAHVFIQLPTHSTYENLQKLDENMVKTYGNLSESAPVMSEPIEYGTICAAPTSYGWHRAIVTSYQPYDETAMTSFTSLNIGDDLNSLTCGIATVKFLDYGGYLNIPANQLRQLR